MTTRRALAVGGAMLAVTLFHATHLHAQRGAPPAATDSRGAPRGGHRGPANVDQHVQRLTTELNLTPDQVTRVRALLTAQRAHADSMRAQAHASHETDRKAMDGMRDDMQKSLDEILTPEQRAKHAELMKQHDGRGMRHGRGDRHGRPDDQAQRQR